MNKTASLWFLRGLALAIAVVTWLFASYLPRLERQTEPFFEREVETSVTYQVPAGYVVLNKRPTVLVRVRGRGEVIRPLEARQVVLQVPFPESLLRTNQPIDVELRRENVSVPPDIEVVSVTPSRLSLVIDEEITVAVPILARLVGEPAAGLTLGDVRTTVDPPTTLVRGPRQKVESLRALETQPINLDGHAFDFSDRVEIVRPDLDIQVLRADIVTVHVGLGSNGPAPPAAGAAR